MRSATGIAGMVLLASLVGCSSPPSVPPTRAAAVPSTLLEQLSEEVSWLRAGACRGDQAASGRLNRAINGGGMVAGDFAWVQGLPRVPLTEGGMLGMHDATPAGMTRLSCGGHRDG